MTKEEFIAKAQKIHGDKYDYSLVPSVVRTIDNVNIICPIHGVFKQNARAHYRQSGCPKCTNEERGRKYRMSIEEFIQKSREHHGDKYDYSLIKEPFKANSEVEIICPIHGVFKQNARAHYRKSGCPKCGNDVRKDKQTRTTEEFIEKAIQKHGHKYDYSHVEYVNNETPMSIICPKHGAFKHTPHEHLRGRGCPKCSWERIGVLNRLTPSRFVEKAREVHGDKYEYHKVKYINNLTPVIITCPIHGDFKQTPGHHLTGQGCWRCRAHLSLFENEVRDYIKSIECNAEFGVRHVLTHFEIDVYSPHAKIGFECDGLYWHSDKNKPKYYHINKTFEAEKQGIQLIHIFEDEWEYKRDICKSLIAKVLGICLNKIAQHHAKLINHEEVKQFLEQNSLIGCQDATLHIGLYSFANDLIAVGSFDDKNDYFEIMQYCERQDVIVENGFKSMVGHFVNRYRPNRLVVKIDKRWANNLQLKGIGFIHIADELPSFKYVKDKRRLTLEEVVADEKWKRKYQERKIPKIYDCGREIWHFSDTTDIS